MAKESKKAPAKSAASKSRSLADIRKRTATATKSLAEIDRDREQNERTEAQKPTTRPLSEIKPRPGPDTRPLHPGHVVALAESISALGLLEPLVVDSEGHLLAGGHRLAAMQLLSAGQENRMELLQSLCERLSEAEHEALQERITDIEWSSEESTPDLVPIRVVDFDATQDTERALAIEAAENTQRRDYTPKEVLALYHRLIEAGYTDRRGKPQKNEKPARPAIAMVIGKSVKTVERFLKRASEKEEQNEAFRNGEMIRALGLLEGAISRVLACAETFEEFAEIQDLVKELQKKKTTQLIQNVRRFLEVS